MTTEETYFNSKNVEERIAQLTDKTPQLGAVYLSMLVADESVRFVTLK